MFLGGRNPHLLVHKGQRLTIRDLGRSRNGIVIEQRLYGGAGAGATKTVGKVGGLRCTFKMVVLLVVVLRQPNLGALARDHIA